MPLQNRVTPFGEIIAHPARGLFLGNRGILHGADKSLGDKRWTTQGWVICTLTHGDTRRTLMTPGQYTELFFLDEAVALAAGHRPCFACRRDRADAFATLWRQAVDATASRAPVMDKVLHRQRVESRTRCQVRHQAPLDGLPDGAFVRLPGHEHALLVLGETLRPFAHDRYGEAWARPRGVMAEVLTPEGTVAAMAAGYAPVLHPSATGA